MSDPKRALVERAVAAAVKARPILTLRATALPTLVAPTDAALAAAQQWLVDGDVARAAQASATAAPAIEKAWLSWDESAGVTKDLVALKRAVHAVEAVMLAVRAAVWTLVAPTSGWDGDAAEARARVSAGSVWEATEAERCAAMAQGVAP